MSLIRKALSRSFFDIAQQLRFRYHLLLTKFWIGPFLKSNGRNNCIIKPIILTPSTIELGNNILIRNGARLEGVHRYEDVEFHPIITIGNNVSIEQNLHLTCAEKITIGEGTAIAANVTITDINHKYIDIAVAPEKQPIETFPVTIGSNCKIYNNSIILPGVSLGTHIIVAGNAVVRAGIYPDYSVLAGSPAIIIKRYDLNTGTWIKTNNKGDFKFIK